MFGKTELNQIFEDIIHPLEVSRNIYAQPIPPASNARIWKYSPAHTGPYRGAIDFLLPSGTQVLAPHRGRIVNVVDKFDKYGPTEKFVDYLNYITIEHENGEFSQVAHLAPNSSTVSPGEEVTKGQAIGTTGLSGWMTEPHLHFFVFKLVHGPEKFQGVRIRFRP